MDGEHKPAFRMLYYWTQINDMVRTREILHEMCDRTCVQTCTFHTQKINILRKSKTIQYDFSLNALQKSNLFTRESSY